MSRPFRGKLPYMGRVFPFWMPNVGDVEIVLVSPHDCARKFAIRTHWQIEGETGGHTSWDMDSHCWMYNRLFGDDHIEGAE